MDLVRTRLLFFLLFLFVCPGFQSAFADSRCTPVVNAMVMANPLGESDENSPTVFSPTVVWQTPLWPEVAYRHQVAQALEDHFSTRGGGAVRYWTHGGQAGIYRVTRPNGFTFLCRVPRNPDENRVAMGFSNEREVWHTLRDGGGPGVDHLVPIQHEFSTQIEGVTVPVQVMTGYSPRNLSDRLADFGTHFTGTRSGTAELLGLFRQVVLAAVQFQQNGLVHRDIKPRNIFVEELANGSLRLRLGDYGLVSRVDEVPAYARMRPNWIFGTTAYLPDEITSLNTGHPVARSRHDTHSLLLVLYNMARGRAFARGHVEIQSVGPLDYFMGMNGPFLESLPSELRAVLNLYQRVNDPVLNITPRDLLNVVDEQIRRLQLPAPVPVPAPLRRAS